MTATATPAATTSAAVTARAAFGKRAADSQPPMLVAVDVEKFFGSFQALKGISLEMPAGRQVRGNQQEQKRRGIREAH